MPKVRDPTTAPHISTLLHLLSTPFNYFFVNVNANEPCNYGNHDMVWLYRCDSSAFSLRSMKARHILYLLARRLTLQRIGARSEASFYLAVMSTFNTSSHLKPPCILSRFCSPSSLRMDSCSHTLGFAYMCLALLCLGKEKGRNRGRNDP